MAKLDPWTSLRLRAEFLTHCMRDDVGSFRPSKKRGVLLASFAAAGIQDELGLRLRDPKEEMPWMTREVEFGSLLHWHWTAFHAMYPTDFWIRVSALAKGDRVGVEDALVFLEVDPWCFRSGYVKQTIARLIRHVQLTEPQRDRLLAALLNGVTVGPRWEFREYCKTARAFETVGFRVKLRQLGGRSKDVPRTGAEQRARWMLEKIERS
jgi:hypothetical protein